MREAIGGTLLIKLVMVFIVIYIAFLAIAINYAITFRVKNQIISLLEAYEGYENAETAIDSYIADVGYFRASTGTSTLVADPDCGGVVSSCNCRNGYCIRELQDPKNNGVEVNNPLLDRVYYKVTAVVKFDFPIIGSIVSFPVSGESTLISKKR